MQHQIPYSFSFSIDLGRGPEEVVYTVMACVESTRSGKQVIRTRTHHEAETHKYDLDTIEPVTLLEASPMVGCHYYWDNIRYAVVRTLCEDGFNDYGDWEEIEKFLFTLPKPFPRTKAGTYGGYDEEDPKYIERLIKAFPEFKIKVLDNGYF